MLCLACLVPSFHWLILSHISYRCKHTHTHSGAKQSILYSREHTVKESMQHVKMWNSAFLQSDDLQEAMRAVLSKDTANFKKN